MISMEHFYINVNVVLGLVCIASIILAFKFVSDKRSRNLLIVTLVLLIISGAMLSFCQKIFRLYAVAYMGDLAGATEGAFEMVDQFRILLPIGNIFELAAIGLCVLVVKRLISLRTAGQSEGGTEE